MPPIQTWKHRFQAELNQARTARQSSNEGKARVCARRAVGVLIGEYLFRHGFKDPGPSAYDRLIYFQSLPDITSETVEISHHFLLRVSTDHTLPGDIDLIAEAEWLANQLLPS